MKYSKFAAPALAAIVLVVSGCASTRTQQSPGESIDDRLITGRVKEALIADPDTKARQIDVETFRGVVQLNGFVDSDTDRSKATTVARRVNGVKEVRNNLQLATTKTSVGEVIDDSVITTKVKAALVADPVTKAFQINVETRDGAVQLSGFVDSAEQQTRAAEVARGVSGVRTVKNSTEVKKKNYQ
jgi:hyperosmotically inducible protein